MSDEPTARRSSRLAQTGAAIVEAIVPAKKRKAEGQKAAPKRQKKAEGAEVEEDAEGDEPKPKSVPKAKKAVEESTLPTEPIELPTGITLKNEAGEDVIIADLLNEEKAQGKKGFVVFLVPKADTPGCTTQACAFRDNYDEFIVAGFDVYCLSADAPDKQKKWKDKKNLPYSLLSDPSREFIAFLGSGAAKTQRSHFVFALKDGKAVMIDKKAKISPKDSVPRALETVKAFNAAA